MEIGKALAATLKPRPKVIDLNDEELDSWKIGQGVSGNGEAEAESLRARQRRQEKDK